MVETVPSGLSFPLCSGSQSTLRDLFTDHHWSPGVCPDQSLAGGQQREAGAITYIIRARTVACPKSLQCRLPGSLARSLIIYSFIGGGCGE